MIQLIIVKKQDKNPTASAPQFRRGLQRNFRGGVRKVRSVSLRMPGADLGTALIFGLFFVGLLAGSLIIRGGNEELIESVRFIFRSFLERREDQAFIESFYNAFLSSFVYVLLIFLCGFSAIGQPLSFCVIFSRGLSIGMAMSYVYQNSGIGGFFYNMIAIFPFAALSCAAVVTAGRAASRMSSTILAALLGRSAKGPITVGEYINKIGISAVFVAASALLDALLQGTLKV